MLIECKECKNKISDKAQSCPHCGIPIKDGNNQVLNYIEKRARFGIDLCICLTIIGVVFFLAAIITGHEIFLLISSIIGIPGIIGIPLNLSRLSDIKQSRNKN